MTDVSIEAVEAPNTNAPRSESWNAGERAVRKLLIDLDAYGPDIWREAARRIEAEVSKREADKTRDILDQRFIHKLFEHIPDEEPARAEIMKKIIDFVIGDYVPDAVYDIFKPATIKHQDRMSRMVMRYAESVDVTIDNPVTEGLPAAPTDDETIVALCHTASDAPRADGKPIWHNTVDGVVRYLSSFTPQLHREVIARLQAGFDRKAEQDETDDVCESVCTRVDAALDPTPEQARRMFALTIFPAHIEDDGINCEGEPALRRFILATPSELEAVALAAGQAVKSSGLDYTDAMRDAEA